MLTFYIGVVVFFAITWIVEYRYGLLKKINTYNGCEFLSNISMGLTSTVVSLCITLISIPLYEQIYSISPIKGMLSNPWLHFLFGLVLYDFLYYWNHRWHHEVSVLWLGHSVHHSGQTFNYSTSLRLGVIASLTSWFMFMPMAIMGVGVEVYLAIYAIQLFYQHLIHTRHIPKLGWLEHVFYTPSHHRVHHARNPQYIDKNHGCFFIVFDKLFGTFAEEKADDEPVYGTTHVVASHTPSRVNFFEVTRMANYLARHGRTARQFIRVLLGNPDYETFTDTSASQPKSRIDLTEYSQSLSTLAVIRFLMGLVIAIAITVVFMEKMTAMQPIELIVAVVLIIGVIDMAAKELVKRVKSGVDWYATLLVGFLFTATFLEIISFSLAAIILVYLALQTFYRPNKVKAQEFEGT